MATMTSGGGGTGEEDKKPVYQSSSAVHINLKVKGQATLALALDILLSEERGLVDLQQGVGRLINAIVAVLGPELSPGSIFFSRCKSVVEMSSHEETATLLESV